MFLIQYFTLSSPGLFTSTETEYAFEPCTFPVGVEKLVKAAAI